MPLPSAGVASIPGVAHVQSCRGARCPPDRAPRLVVEVPHGADELAHYRACEAQLRGTLPLDLHHFFLANTDVGAWALGVAAAEHFVAQHPTEAALLIRCLVPRTLIDCNRELDARVPGGMSRGLPVYITDPDDEQYLLGLHAQYVALTDRAFAGLEKADGLALVPHTYAPRTVDIATVELDIVDRMHAAWAPGVAETWPLRPEVDLITETPEGQYMAPPGIGAALTAALAQQGLTAVEGGTYTLHPATRGATLSAHHPGRLLCLEVRRDLIVTQWTPFSPMVCDPVAVQRIAEPLGRCLAAALPPTQDR